MRDEVTQVEIAALLAVAQDHAFGQPPGSQLRATVLGQHLATAAGARCGGAGDHVVDVGAALPRLHRSRLRDGGGVRRRDRAAGGVAAGRRLQPGGVPAPDGQPGGAGSVRCRSAAVRAVPPGRWPQGRRAELPHRVRGRGRVRQAARPGRARARRAGRELRALERARPAHRLQGHGDPAADAGRPARRRSSRSWPASRASPRALSHRSRPGATRPTTRSSPISSSREGAAWWEAVEPADSWDAALAVAPPCAPLDDAAVHESLLVLADFADLKSPWTSGHSRAVAALALRGVRAGGRGRSARPRPRLRRRPQLDLGQARPAHTRRARPRRDPRARDRPAAAAGPVHRDARRHGLRRARALRRLRLPPARQRRRTSTRPSGSWRRPTATRP